MSQTCTHCHAQTDAFLCVNCARDLTDDLAKLPGMLTQLEVNRARQDKLGGTGASAYSTRKTQIGIESQTLVRAPDPDSTTGGQYWYGINHETLPAHLRTTSGRVALPVTPWAIGWDASNLLAETRLELHGWIRHLTESRGVVIARKAPPPGLEGPVCHAGDCHPAHDADRRPQRRHPSCDAIIRSRDPQPWRWTDVDLCAWLVAALPAIRMDEAAAELLDGIRWYHQQIESLIDRRDGDLFAGRCDAPDFHVHAYPPVGPTCEWSLTIDCGHESCAAIREQTVEELVIATVCGVELRARMEDAKITCEGCGASYTYADRKQELLEQLPDQLARAQVVADALTSLDMPVTVNQITTWVARRKLKPSVIVVDVDPRTGVPRPVYRLGDVQALVEAATAKAKARRELKAAG